MEYIITQAEYGMQIKDVLKRRFGYSSKLLRKLKLSGGIFMDGQPVKLFETVRSGNVITVVFPKEESYFEPQDIPIEVVFEDEDILIINKQPGIVVHPTKGHSNGTIANAITYYMRQGENPFKIRFVNRLDRDTSGLLIIAKNSFSQEHISKQMKSNDVVKQYIAVVDGVLEQEEDFIDLPIAREEGSIITRKVSPLGQASLTKYKVLERFANHTLVELTLLSGRTHQIRVHMSYIGHPVTGDTLYGREEGGEIQRQALHSAYLSIEHPRQKTQMELTAPIPLDIKELITSFKSVKNK